MTRNVVIFFLQQIKIPEGFTKPLHMLMNDMKKQTKWKYDTQRSAFNFQQKIKLSWASS